jgi:perosamine synthetase
MSGDLVTMIPYGKHHVDDDDIKAVVDVLKNKFLTQGPMIEKFEKAICDYVGAKYAVAVSSGTAALHLSALASGVKPGSSIVTSPITFVSTANASFYCGGDVHFADIDPLNINISPNKIENIVKENNDICAIFPVHFAGLPCDMEALSDISKRYNLSLVEDAAHALGASYSNGQKVGSCCYSDMTIFSFHPVKSIAAGEGGLITTNDESLYRKLIRLRSHGINKLDDSLVNEAESKTDGSVNPWYYEMQELGFHYRITDIQCALALSQLNKLNKFVDRRRVLVNKYDSYFKGLEFIKPAQNLERELSSHHLYVLRIEFDKFNITRSEFMRLLRKKEIITQVHYIPLPIQPYYKSKGFDIIDYPEANSYYQEAISIPLFYDLTDDQQAFVVKVILEILR